MTATLHLDVPYIPTQTESHELTTKDALIPQTAFAEPQADQSDPLPEEAQPYYNFWKTGAPLLCLPLHQLLDLASDTQAMESEAETEGQPLVVLFLGDGDDVTIF